MLLQRITDFVLRSRYHAMLAAFVCDLPVIFTVPANSVIYSTLVLVVSTFGIAIVGLVTLRKGSLDGFFALIAATVPYLLGYLIYPDDYSQQVIILSELVVQLSNVLTWVCAVLLYRTNSWSFTLEIFAVILIVGILCLHAIFPDMQAWWGEQLHQAVAKALKTTSLANADALTGSPAELNASVNKIIPFATRGAILFLWINTLLQLMIARWWQEKVFNPGGIHRELHEVRLSQTAGVLFVIGLLLSFLQSETIADVMIVFYLTFGFAGLSVAHYIAASLQSKGKWMLFLVYAVLPLFVIIIPMVGLLDVWLNFRKRFQTVKFR